MLDKLRLSTWQHEFIAMFLPALYENKQLYDVQIVDMTFFHFYGRPYSQCIDVMVIFFN